MESDSNIGEVIAAAVPSNGRGDEVSLISSSDAMLDLPANFPSLA
jgi:hypothetical protein